VLAYLIALDAELDVAAALAFVQQKRWALVPPTGHLDSLFPFSHYTIMYSLRPHVSSHSLQSPPGRRMAQPNPGFMASLVNLHARGWFAEVRESIVQSR
jgi:hypothetical protein